MSATTAVAHQTVAIDRVKRDLHKYHEHVIRNWGRIVITRDGIGDAACVLISKAELDHLERALEIYCESPGGKAMCEEIDVIAMQSTARVDRAPAALTDPPELRNHKTRLARD